MLKVRFDFPIEKMIETMDRFALSKRKKLLKERFDFPIWKIIETMDRLAIIQVKNNVETTVSFSNLEHD